MTTPTRNLILLCLALGVVVTIAIWHWSPPPKSSPLPPSVPTEPLAPLAGTISEFNVPLSIPLSVIGAGVNAAIQPSFSGDEKVKGIPIEWRASRDSIRVEVRDATTLSFVTRARGSANVDFPGLDYLRKSFTVRIRVAASPGLGSRWNAKLDYKADVDFSPRIPSFRVPAWRKKWGIPFPTTRKIDPQKRIETKIADQIEDREADAESQVSELVKQYAQRAWEGVCRDVAVPRSPGLWLEVRPISARTGGMRLSARTLVVQLGVEARMRISKSPDPPSCSFPPQLAVGRNWKEGEFEITMPVVLGYEELSEELSKQVVGHSYGGDEFSAIVDSVRVQPHGEALLLSADVRVSAPKYPRGKFEGTLYVVGRPHLDTRTQVITLEDMELSTYSRDRLTQVLARLSERWISEAFEDKAIVNLGPVREDVRGKANDALKGLSHGAVTWSAEVDSVQMVRIDIGAERFRVVGMTSGRARASINEEPN